MGFLRKSIRKYDWSKVAEKYGQGYVDEFRKIYGDRKAYAVATESFQDFRDRLQQKRESTFGDVGGRDILFS